jgi:hypothetical protein
MAFSGEECGKVDRLLALRGGHRPPPNFGVGPLYPPFIPPALRSTNNKKACRQISTEIRESPLHSANGMIGGSMLLLYAVFLVCYFIIHRILYFISTYYRII